MCLHLEVIPPDRAPPAVRLPQGGVLERRPLPPSQAPPSSVLRERSPMSCWLVSGLAQVWTTCFSRPKGCDPLPPPVVSRRLSPLPLPPACCDGLDMVRVSGTRRLFIFCTPS